MLHTATISGVRSVGVALRCAAWAPLAAAALAEHFDGDVRHTATMSGVGLVPSGYVSGLGSFWLLLHNTATHAGVPGDCCCLRSAPSPQHTRPLQVLACLSAACSRPKQHSACPLLQVLACLMRHFRASLASLPLLAQPLSALPIGTWAPTSSLAAGIEADEDEEQQVGGGGRGVSGAACGEEWGSLCPPAHRLPLTHGQPGGERKREADLPPSLTSPSLFHVTCSLAVSASGGGDSVGWPGWPACGPTPPSPPPWACCWRRA